MWKFFLFIIRFIENGNKVYISNENKIKELFMKKILRKHFHLIFIGVFIGILQMFALTKVQFIKGQVLNVAMQKNMNELPQVIFKLFAAIFIMAIFGYLFSFVNCVFMERSSKSLRELFFQSFLGCSYKKYFYLDEGELMAKYSKEISVIEQNCFSLVGTLVQMVLQILFVSAALFYLNSWLAVISFVILVAPVLVPKIFQKKVSNRSYDKMSKVEKNISVVNGILNGFEIIKNFGIEKNIFENFKKSNDNLMDAENEYEKSYAVSTGVSFAFSLGSQALIMIIAGFYIYFGFLKAGDFFTIAGLIASLRVPLYWISTMFQTLIATKPIRKSVFAFIENNIPMRETAICNPLDNQQDLSVFVEDLSYAYEDKNFILDHIHLKFEANKKYLIIGESGCGKSTLMNLLLNYDELDSGRISVNGIDIKELSDMEKIITIARQEAVIFSGTIRDNLTLYDTSISKDEFLETMLKKVGLNKFVTEGLDYILEEDGINLSGGEKKRFSLARALIRETPILILDEPLANLDGENMEKVENLISDIKNKLVIVISHQVSDKLRQKFDFVMELKGGRMNVETLPEA